MTSFRRALGPTVLLALSAACARGPMSAVRPAPSGLEAHFRGAARLAELLSTPGCAWVSDADGTLWSEDIGEGFLKQLIADKALVSPAATGDIWAAYDARVRADKASGYAWAAQAMAGLTEADVAARAEAYAATFVPAHLFPGMRALLSEARTRGCEVWIVSASNEWIVRAAAPLLGLDPSHAVGIRVAVKDGTLTDTVVPPVTYRAGKVDAILARVGRLPSLVSGDSAGDLEMLAAATGAGLFVEHDYTDPAVLGLARERGWLVEPLGRP